MFELEVNIEQVIRGGTCGVDEDGARGFPSIRTDGHGQVGPHNVSTLSCHLGAPQKKCRR